MFDLYLGGDLGIWALGQIPTDMDARIITMDPLVLRACKDQKRTSIFGNVNKMDFKASGSALSIHYPRILTESVLSNYVAAYNVHPGYLPWGKGFFPIFWALWEGTPAGATLHEMIKNVDAGPIVDQVQVEYDESDTGGSLFDRVRAAEKLLIQKYLHAISKGERLPTVAQQPIGTYHSKAEFIELKQGSKWKTMSAIELLRLVRCLTFPGYTNLEVDIANTRHEVRLHRIESERSRI